MGSGTDREIRQRQAAAITLAWALVAIVALTTPWFAGEVLLAVISAVVVVTIAWLPVPKRASKPILVSILGYSVFISQFVAMRHGYDLPTSVAACAAHMGAILIVRRPLDMLVVSAFSFAGMYATPRLVSPLLPEPFVIVTLLGGFGATLLRRKADRAVAQLKLTIAAMSRSAVEAAVRGEITSALIQNAGSLRARLPPALRAIRRAVGCQVVALMWDEDAVVLPRQNPVHKAMLAAGRSPEDVAASLVGGEKHHQIVALRHEGKRIGVLALGGRKPIDHDLVNGAVRPALGAAFGAALGAIAAERHTRLQRGLTRLARTASGSLDAREMINQVLRVVREELDADRAIVRFPSASGKLPVLGEVNADGVAPLGERGMHLNVTDGPAGDRPVVLDDLYGGDTEVKATTRGILAAWGVRSAVLVPLPLQDGSRAWLSVHVVRRHRRFTDAEVTFCEQACAHIAVALETIRRYDKEVEASRLKSDFIAHTSHELRTPLHAILGHSQLLGSSGDERAKSAAASIREAGNHLLALVNNLLDMARIEAGRITVSSRPIDLRDLVSSAARLATGAVKDRPVSVVTMIPEETAVVVDTDATRARQVLVNLVGNAAKFTESGTITITLSADRARGEATISVSDTGPGIDPSNHEAIFEKFRQLGGEAGDGRGAGLGLPISRELAALLGGRLRVESEIGRGATFYFTLPWQAPEDHGIAAA